MSGSIGVSGLREWTDCRRFMELVPRIGGLPPKTLRFTAIASCRELLALAAGSHLFLYERQRHRIRRLKAINSNSPFTVLRLASCVDFMLAAADCEGRVTIFQIPKPHPEDVPECVKPKPAQIERYTVNGLHRSEITFLEWSKNGMKLFSGDKNGIVVMTEIDFYMHICKSSEIINETYEIVQLSYFQNYLLVSSVYRCILCHYIGEKWTVNQVGKKERKTLCKLGGVFHFNYDKPNDLNIYSARPGLRLWTSDKEGNVLNTLLFKEAVLNPTNKIVLINPGKSRGTTVKDLNFGPLLIFNEKYVLTYNEEAVYILDPESLLAVATIDNLNKIISVCTSKDEIFIIDGERSLVRLGYGPENPPQISSEKLMTRSLFNPLELAINTIKDLTSLDSKKDWSSYNETYDNMRNMDLESPVISTDCTSIVRGEECFELPPIVSLSDEPFASSSIPILEPIFDENYADDNVSVDSNVMIGEEFKYASTSEPNQIPKAPINVNKVSCTKKYKKSNIVDIPSKSELEKSKKSNSINRNSPLNKLSDVNSDKIAFKCPILEDKSPETLERELREKEQILAKMFNLEPVTAATFPLPQTIESSTSDSSYEKEFVRKPKIVKPPPKKDRVNPEPFTTPNCVSIPNLWNLKEIKISSSDSDEPSIHSKMKRNNSQIESDWEII